MPAFERLVGGTMLALVIAPTLVLFADAASEAASGRCFGRRVTIQGTNEDDRIEGTRGADVIMGRDGDDIIYGLGGKDRICSGGGDDSVDGGSGADRISSGGGRRNTGGNTIRGGTGDDLLVGGPVKDQLNGGAGNDVARGKGGSDLLYGTPGSNKLFGGKDEGAFGDLVQYPETDARLLVNLTRGRGRGDGRDLLSGIEDVYVSSAATIVGTSGSNFLVGSVVADRMEGKGGDDCLLPHGGADEIRGGPGFDAYTGDVSDFCASDDLVGGISPLNSGIRVDLAKGEAETGGSTSTLTSIEAVYGTSRDDQLYGDDETNLLDGGGSRDDIAGRGGDDSLSGGGGMDTVDGGDGTDDCRDAEVALNCEEVSPRRTLTWIRR